MIRTLVGFILAYGLTSTAYTQEQTQPLKLAAYDIPALLQKDGKGKYDVLIKRFGQQVNKLWQYDILPPSRADRLFAIKAIDCIVPYDAYFSPLENVINSSPLDVAKAYVFTAEDTAPIQHLAELTGKRVGARNGMLYGGEFDNKKFNIQLVEAIKQNIDKLQAGRIDAFVAWAPDVFYTFKELGMEALPHADPFVIHKDAFLCHNTPQAQQFIDEFNRGAMQFKQ